MINTQTNEFETADSIDELKEKVSEEARGAIFQRGEHLTIRGYVFEVQILDKRGMFLKPVGPVETRQARRQRELYHRMHG